MCVRQVDLAFDHMPEAGSLYTRLDKLEAAMRGRDGGEPADGLICRRLIYDPSEWQIEEDEAISRMKAEELDRLVAAGRIGEIDREHARFIVRILVHPPERLDDPSAEKAPPTTRRASWGG